MHYGTALISDWISKHKKIQYNRDLSKTYPVLDTNGEVTTQITQKVADALPIK